MKSRTRRRAFLILAGAKPPETLGFQSYSSWWWKKVPTKLEALEIANKLARLDIHGIIKICYPDKPAKPTVVRNPPIKPKSEPKMRFAAYKAMR